MFVRKKPNKSGSVSIQIVDKSSGKYQVIKTIGSSSDQVEIEYLWQKAHALLPSLVGQTSLDFQTDRTKMLLMALSDIQTDQILVDGPEIVFGQILNDIGFDKIQDDLFRHMVITRLVYPGSKLKTIDYLYRFKGVQIDISKVYRFLDKLHGQHKEQIEQIAFEYTKRVLDGNVNMLFYDMTTLYFEASDEDDLRKTGFSKDGKSQQPQILLGLLVGEGGYPIGYEIFEGNTFEGHTLIPVLEHFQKKFNLSKPVIVADAGLLSNNNIEQLKAKGYHYILGARIKNESIAIKKKILEFHLADGQIKSIKKSDEERLIIGFSDKRAEKDLHNRQRGLKRLEKQLNAGRLTKSNINNKGYNKYLKLTGEIKIEIDYDKYTLDNQWDGLKGYLTNSNLTDEQVLNSYNNLWQIEKAFRISKTDLKVRPIYHRLRNRIEAHLSISFVAYTIYKEVERRLKLRKIPLSVKRVIELTLTMYKIIVKIPETNQKVTVPMKWTKEQMLVKKIILL
jgi:transposase